MGYSIKDKLVVAVSSTALFDFSKEHRIFLEEGVEAFRQYQRDNREVPPKPGAAFPFIKRLLHLNKVFREQQPVEVIILSRNDPEAGLRMMDALPHYELEISPTCSRSTAASTSAPTRTRSPRRWRRATQPATCCPAPPRTTTATPSCASPSTLMA
jgi:hypothetical protein